jgi:hypothetical protein
MESKKKKLTDILINPSTDAAPKAANIDFEKECRITSKTMIPETIPSITIDDSWLCTDGGILVVSGQKKAGKSNAIVYIIATALMEEVDTEKTLRIRSKKQDLDIVYIDTEQSPSKTKEFINRAKRIANFGDKDPENLRFYNIRKLDLEKRNEFLKWILQEPQKIGLLIIDGIADFVKSINDEEKARELGDFIFSKIHDKMSVVTAIHEGKDGQGAMGHLGQFLEKKCSGTIGLFKNRKDKQVPTHRIVCKMVREGGDFDDIDFVWSDTEKGFVIMNEEMKNIIKGSTEERKTEELRQLISLAFYDTMQGHSKVSLRDKIITIDKEIKPDLKTESKKKAADRRIQKAFEFGFLKEGENGNLLKNF